MGALFVFHIYMAENRIMSCRRNRQKKSPVLLFIFLSSHLCNLYSLQGTWLGRPLGNCLLVFVFYHAIPFFCYRYYLSIRSVSNPSIIHCFFFVLSSVSVLSTLAHGVNSGPVCHLWRREFFLYPGLIFSRPPLCSNSDGCWVW